jgi:hypothetical protein
VLLATLDRSSMEGQGFEGGGGGCWVEQIFGPNGEVVGEQEICEGIGRPVPLPGEPPPPIEVLPVPECPPNAECTLDGELWEVCTTFDDGRGNSGGECTVAVIGPGMRPPPQQFDGVQLEVYDHDERTWVFTQEALDPRPDGTATLDPARFLSPLGEVFVRAAGNLFPFDYSGRGLAATVGGAA